VAFTGGAQACDVFWVVGSSATLGTNSSFAGILMALTSASVQTGATVAGRILARNGAVSLDDNTFTQAACSSPAASPSTATTATPSTGALTGSNVGVALGLGAVGAILLATGLAWAAVTRSRIEIAGGPRRTRRYR
jgi:drug/metabolite transporter (DMT)-like permease